MSDLSEAVASHVLQRGADGRPDASGLLLFRPRNGWVGVLVFGSWGVVISVPLTMFALSGELPAASLPALLGLASVGYGLVYLAVRSVMNRARLQRDGDELRFSFGPMWPFRHHRWRLAHVRTADITQRPPSFWHPARYRGYPMPQPYFVDVCLASGERSRLPVTLSATDAQAVTQFVERRGEPV